MSEEGDGLMRRKLMNWMLVLVVLVSTVAPAGRTATAAGDKTGILADLSAEVSQDGNVITGSDKIKSNLPIDVKASFGVPVEGDGVAEVIEYLDTAILKLSEKFSLVSGTNIELRASDNTLVGHVTLISDPAAKKINAQIVFDGDPDVFNDPGISGVSAWFKATLEYDGSNGDDAEGDHEVTILGKTYIVEVPPVEIVYDVAKSGTADLANRTIDWKVEVTATQDVYSLDLKDYIFSDNLTGVGELVTDSFKVNGVPVTSDAGPGNGIQYTFPDHSVSPQAVTFQTKIPEDKYYANYSQSVSNTAELLKDSVSVKNGSTTVSFTPPKWIEKSGEASGEYVGGEYNPDDRMITWTITANRAMASLENLTIKDQLPNGLAFVSAKWETSTDPTDESSWNYHSDVSSEPTNGEYTLTGTVNEAVRLIITSKVTDTSVTTGKRTFYNSATLDWDGKPSGVNPGTGSIGVGIGYDAITKTGTLDKGNREITWKVNVDAKGQSILDMKVYDLLVYKNNIDLDAVTGLPSTINKADLTPHHGLKYVTDSYMGDGILKVIPIEQGGERVADLLEVTDLSTSPAHSFSFKTLVVDPDVFAGNKNSNVSNTASLFDGVKKLNSATGIVNYDSRMLEKELLKREAQADPAEGVNIHRTNNAAEGFDYTDKSVIFRLSINTDGLDFNAIKNADDEVLGAATVTDTLPTGWEFVDFEPGQKYLVFEGTPGSGSSVDAVDTTPDDVAGLTADFLEAGKATFTFSPLNKSYVILVKAKPSESTLDGYFDGNKTSNAANNVKLTAEKWTTGVSRTQAVSIKSEIIKKTPTVPQQGTLNWTVDYNPYILTKVGEKIEDTLPIGIDLRTDSKGVLLLDGIAVKELMLKENGTLEEGHPVPLAVGGNISYDNASRVLTFIIPDSSKAYRLNYLTDITGNPGSVTNQVRLSKGNGSPVTTNAGYMILAADGAATMTRSGWLEITKTDGSTTAPLSGVTFKLYSSDGNTVIREGVSDASGKLRLLGLPIGEYVLRETSAPAGYHVESTTWQVSVTSSGGRIFTSIDGKTGTDSNQLAVVNFKTGTAGNLAISKTVAGNDGDLNKKFNFTVTFTGAAGTYSYFGTGGASNGTISSGDTISLAHREGIVITGLPKDIEYTVTETDYSPEGYITASIDAVGIIAADDTQSAAFTNTKDKPGSLVISKTVAGNAGDQSKKFDFTVQFSASGEYEYFGNGGAADGRIQSGDTVSLAHGESIAIVGLPKDTAYSVTEADYAAEGYAQSSLGDTGIILTDSILTASFVNTKNVYVPSEPGPSPSPGTDPSGPNTPADPGNTKDPESHEEPSTGDDGDIDDKDGGGVSDGASAGEDSVGGGSGDAAAPGGDESGTGSKSNEGATKGTPKTSDTSFQQAAKLGFIFFLLALAALFLTDSILRSRRYPKNEMKP